jgi:hypothetical protein
VSVEDITNSVLASVAKLIDAKFEGLQDRLLPERNYRPPLVADRRPHGLPSGDDPRSLEHNGANRREETLPEPRPVDPQVPTISAQVRLKWKETAGSR